jgi:hypothetical protein
MNKKGEIAHNRVHHKIEDGIELKICNGCNRWLPLDKFGKYRKYWDGLTKRCKECRNNYNKNEDPSRIANRKKRFYSKNPGYNKKYYLKNKEELLKQGKIYYKLHKEQHNKISKQYRETHKAEINAWARRRKREHPEIKLIANLRSRLSGIVSGKRKDLPMTLLIGCTLEELKLHIESQFTEEMSWENYGEWHIDHIKACYLYNLLDLEQQKQCFHYSNLRPLWASENCSLGAKLLASTTNNKGE